MTRARQHRRERLGGGVTAVLHVVAEVGGRQDVVAPEMATAVPDLDWPVVEAETSHRDRSDRRSLGLPVVAVRAAGQ